jgi:hypothetical protein
MSIPGCSTQKRILRLEDAKLIRSGLFTVIPFRISQCGERPDDAGEFVASDRPPSATRPPSLEGLYPSRQPE